MLKLPLVVFGAGAALLTTGFLAAADVAKIAGVFLLGGSYLGLLVKSV